MDLIIIIQIWTLVMQVFILISIIQMTAESWKGYKVRGKMFKTHRSVMAVCPKCNYGQFRRYIIIKPKTGKCPYCGADVKYKKKKCYVGYNYR